jgi:cell division protein FtsZ
MGAAVDAELKNRLSVTVIAARRGAVAPTAGDPVGSTDLRSVAVRSETRCPSSSPSMNLNQREQLLARHEGRPRRTGSKMRQEQLPLAIISKGRFDKSEPTVHKGEDLDIPTFVRRGVALN